MSTASTAQRPSEAPRTQHHTTRVAPREIRDVAYRALRVAGTCSGQASLASRAVLQAELAQPDADGLAMLLDELSEISLGQPPARFTGTPVPVLDDPARRGLFFAVPAGVEHLLAHGDVMAVLLPAACLRPGAHALAVVAAADRASELELSYQPVSPEAPGGILVRRRSPAEAALGLQRGARGDAEITGVFVDRAQWCQAEAAAQPYLVPES